MRKLTLHKDYNNSTRRVKKQTNPKYVTPHLETNLEQKAVSLEYVGQPWPNSQTWSDTTHNVATYLMLHQIDKIQLRRHME